MPTSPRVALVHDWLLHYRGGERVLEAFCEIYPEAPIFTLFYDKGRSGPIIDNHPVHTSFLDRFSKRRHYYRYLLPIMPLAIERFDLQEFDVVISSHHCVAKGIITRPDALHLSYCHTPMRYIWDCYADYFRGGGLKDFFIYPISHYLRMWDVSSSSRVDQFVANSKWVQSRILKYYRRDSAVIHPSVDISTFQIGHGDSDYYLVVSALVPYKRIEIAIQACERLKKKLRIVGEGPEMNRLKKCSGKFTEFLGRVSKIDMADLYGGARALIFPGIEDFGIAPVEAMACGKPVIAYGRGGASETVINNQTGILFYEQSVNGLTQAIFEFEKIEFLPHTCRKQALNFSKENFKSAWENLMLSSALTTQYPGSFNLNRNP